MYLWDARTSEDYESHIECAIEAYVGRNGEDLFALL